MVAFKFSRYHTSAHDVIVNEWVRFNCKTCSAGLYEDEQPRSRSVVLRTKFMHCIRVLPYTGSLKGMIIGKHWGVATDSGISCPFVVQHRVPCGSAITQNKLNWIKTGRQLSTHLESRMRSLYMERKVKTYWIELCHRSNPCRAWLFVRIASLPMSINYR